MRSVRVLSQEENGIGGPVPRDSADCDIHFLAAVMP